MQQTTMTEMTQALKMTNEKAATLNQVIKELAGSQQRYNDTELKQKIAELRTQDSQLLQELFSAWDVALARADTLGPSLDELQDLVANFMIFQENFHLNLNQLTKLMGERGFATVEEIKKISSQRIATVEKYVDALKDYMANN